MAQAEPIDAVALLKADHRKVEDLFEQFEKARSKDRKEALAHEICTELKVHAKFDAPGADSQGTGLARMLATLLGTSALALSFD